MASLEELGKSREALRERLKNCNLCPHRCGVSRLDDKIGNCGIGKLAIVSSYGPHFGEEPVLVGRYGSGTVFFSGCSLHCVFCQNYEISQLRLGSKVTPERLASIFLEIQKMGCHNLNLVTPTHVVAQIVEALCIAKRMGFNLPIVYNSGGYDSVDVLRELEGIVDIYMPDVKYSNSKVAEKYSGIKNYWEIVQEALREMHRQVGDLVIENGIARRGLLVRHLVLPNNLAGSEEILRFISEEISKNTYINIMDQYYPTFKAFEYPELSRRITTEEYREVVKIAEKLGFWRGIPFDYM